MYDRNRRVVGPGLLVGMWITALGLIFLLDQMGIVPAHYSFQLVWPGLLIAAGLWLLLSHSGNRFWGVILLAWGGTTLSNQLGFLHIHVIGFWPLLLIALGIWMLANSSGKFGGWHPRDGWHPEPVPPPPPPPPGVADAGASGTPPASAAPSSGTPSGTGSAGAWPSGGGPGGSWTAGSGPTGPWTPGVGPAGFAPPHWSDRGAGSDSGSPTFDQSVILSGFKRRITSQQFRYGKVSAVMGGFHLDFSRADIDGDRAVLQVDALFGGGEVRVPDTWDVVIEGSALAGAFVDETYGRPAGAPPNTKKLIVRGTTVFGGVSIKN